MWILRSQNLEPISRLVPKTWFALEANEQRDVTVKDLVEHEIDASRTWESWNSQWRDSDRQRLVK